MSEAVYTLRSTRSYRAHRGQMLIVALAVLFILLFIGGVFVAQIARNLEYSARSRDTQDTLSFAESGIRYCDTNLTYSAEGADWRPIPTAANSLTPNEQQDPDYQWLYSGFTRVFFKGGRALVRVSYDPHPDDPRSQYIKIESIGRSGEIGTGFDPTVFVPPGGNTPRLRRELIAYKQIGLTDYLFFLTNKNHTSTENFIGAPALDNAPGTATNNYHDPAVVLGDPTLSLATFANGLNGNEVLFGAPIRSNGDLRLGGDMFIYESPRGTSVNGQPNVSPENVLSSGDILLGPTRDVNGDGTLNDQDQQAFLNAPLSAVGNGKGNSNQIYSSNDPSFNTYGGLIRDGRTRPDAFGFSNSIPYLAPMVMDGYIPGTGILRYRALTRDSGTWVNGNYNTGFNGWGRGIYVNNPDDLQPETQGVSGGLSLPEEWLHPDPRRHWLGPTYRPPGILVELLGDHLRLTRSDGQTFKKPDGTPITINGGKVIDIPFSDTDRTNYRFADGTAVSLPPLPRKGDTPALRTATAAFLDAKSYGVDVVIMAEGNVRVKGVYGTVTAQNSNDHLSRVHVTIVSGGTAYIEGNLLKGDGYFDGTKLTMERASTCAILAKDYVTVNPTMFMAPQDQSVVWSQYSPGSPYYMELGTSTSEIDTQMSFGAPPSTYQVGNTASPLYLMVSHTSNGFQSPFGSGMNLQINPGLQPNPTNAPLATYLFNLPGGIPAETYALSQRYNGIVFLDDPTQHLTAFEERAFALRGATNPNGTLNPTYYSINSTGGSAFFPTLANGPVGFDNVFRFNKDTTASTPGYNPNFQEPNDYDFGGAMVTPLDIRIEASLYAQERSFFIIPGPSFNNNPVDTRLNYVTIGQRPSYSSFDTGNDRLAKDLFPFYGEPMDIRLTLFGSIAMNYAASMGDQTQWMTLWGYIPVNYGSSGETVPDDHVQVHDASVNSNQAVIVYHPGEDRTTDFRTPREKSENITRGLHFMYDPTLAMPYEHASGADLLDSVSASAIQTRRDRALRFNVFPATATVGEIRQTLPSIPRLPVCPGLLYFGDSSQPIVP